MNITPNGSTRQAHALHTNAAHPAARFDRRERDFGIGYGSSSGYASARRYTRESGNQRFRVA